MSGSPAFHAYHHVALRVSDLERSTRFYTEVFPGRMVFENRLDAAFVHEMLGGRPGTSARSRFIAFDGGSAIELFAFDPPTPITPTDETAAGIMHVCLWVDDVPGTIQRVIDGGGTSSRRVQRWDSHHVAFVEDPDGHVIELVDTTLDDALRLMSAPSPEPGARIVPAGQ